jgi:hypothetical protein
MRFVCPESNVLIPGEFEALHYLKDPFSSRSFGPVTGRLEWLRIKRQDGIFPNEEGV